MGNAVYAFALGVAEFITFFAILFLPFPPFVALAVASMGFLFGLGVMKGWLNSVESRMLGQYILGKFIYPVFLALIVISSPGGPAMVLGFAAIALMDSASTIAVSYLLPVSGGGRQATAPF